MRPVRLVILLVCFVVLPTLFTFASLLSAHPRQKLSNSGTVSSQKTGIRALFSFNTPSSLFPPSAIISLTDDNSTFFVARPAAFGPLLPSKSLSGQLWVGSGFGDDSNRRGGVIAGAEGELGCSDIPGWREEDDISDTAIDEKAKKQSKAKGPVRKGASLKKSSREENAKRNDDLEWDESTEDLFISEDDGTDDHLHQPLVRSILPRSKSSSRNKLSEHADIQSLQESAEIAGKVVLLSRGGCGFLEKAKWTQRRGGIALIVGDDTRGGGLVTMYARGDTSNISIPSLFTSHTTAHLLSSLIPSDIEYGQPKHKSPAKPNKGNKFSFKKEELRTSRRKQKMRSEQSKDRPNFTPTSHMHKATDFAQQVERGAEKQNLKNLVPESPFPSKESPGVVRSLLSALGLAKMDRVSTEVLEDKHRPPSSGQLEWTLVEEWFDEEAENNAKLPSGKDDDRAGYGTKPGIDPSENMPSPDKDFVIGIHDWRDPDLIGDLPSKESEKSTKQKGDSKHVKSPTGNAPVSKYDSNRKKSAKASDKESELFEGGSITPGSGEYRKSDSKSSKSSSVQKMKDAQENSPDHQNSEEETDGQHGWLDNLWSKGAVSGDSNTKPNPGSPSKSAATNDDSAIEYVDEEAEENDDDQWEEHEGLWVTLTPTSMSTSPFFDTLLVLVVSPLVTLTVVYALLLLRSRLRRRRWRAPKSVVDRLPVRTYRSTPPQTSNTARNTASPPRSPLTQSESSPNLVARARPRSRTTSGIPAYLDGTRSTSFSPSGDAGEVPDTSDDEEKGNTGWRQPYNGKQVECVVCLEEYIDGVSKVMSLPCGHEFHAECM